MPSRLLAVCGALLLALAAPPAAGAATIDPLDKSCYVTAGTVEDPQAENIAITARGFTANAKVDLFFDGLPVENGTGLSTDGNGAIGVLSPLVVPAPFIAAGSAEFTITLSEQGNPANSASIVARHTALDVSVRPKQSPTGARIRFRGSGFAPGKPVYAHYVFRRKLRRTVKMARNPGVCGQWRKRARQIPVDAPSAGIWTVQFDQLKRYRNPARTETFNSDYVQLDIEVTKTRR